MGLVIMWEWVKTSENNIVDSTTKYLIYSFILP